MQALAESTVDMNEYYLFEDILEAQKNQGRGVPLKKYDPLIFWDGIGERWYQSFNRREKLASSVAWIIDRLKTLKVNNVLEVGCGFGRLAPFLLDGGAINEVHGVDISPKVLSSSIEYLTPNTHYQDDIAKMKIIMSDANLPKSIKDAVKPLLEKELGKTPHGKATPPDFRDKIHLSVDDARDLGFEDNSFDCVLTCEMLQHLSKEDVLLAAKQIQRVSKDWIVLIERWQFPNEHSEPHIWSHDISKIFSEIGCQVLQATTVQPGLQGVICRK